MKFYMTAVAIVLLTISMEYSTMAKPKMYLIETEDEEDTEAVEEDEAVSKNIEDNEEVAKEIDKKERINMGAQIDCDDGKSQLEVDWSGDERDTTCAPQEKIASLEGNQNQKVNCVSISEDELPLEHFCMNDKITYEKYARIPRYGPHRPVWPVFGEYKYVPIQRWLHNVEHGALILLYHPCVNKTQLNTVRNIVTGCIRKHIITPSRLVLPSAPIALVAWGCSLEMASLDQQLVRTFIKDKGLHGPEGQLSKQGQYSYLLIHEAKPPLGSDVNDSVLCPPTPLEYM